VAINPHTNEDLAAVGIMIDDVDMENGPMMVVLGSHKGRSTTTMAGRTVLRRDGPG
jgi:ectoine hydroxylase-related dioxygenase (phytanoyl-CoA dioxygenase family)